MPNPTPLRPPRRILALAALLALCLVLGLASAQDITPISTIQGDGPESPLRGERVTVEGIVTADFQSNREVDQGELGGFFVQSAEPDEDPATPEGIFVFDSRGRVDVRPGDRVRVTGAVSEYYGKTQLGARRVEVLESGVPLPAPAEVRLPADAAELERFEGMRVIFPQALTISEYFNFDRFGEIVLALPLEGTPRPFQPTAFDTEERLGLSPVEVLAANDAHRVTLDDASSEENPAFARHPNGEAFDLDNRFRGGDTVTNAVGVLDYAFDRYRLQPTAPATHTARNPRPAAPAEVGGSVQVAAFNVLNYFPTLDGSAQGCGPDFDQDCRGADDAEEFDRQEAKIVAAIGALGADAVGLVEIQNNAGATGALVDALNAAAGAPLWAAAEDGVVGTDAIKVSLIYRPDALTPLGDPAVLDAPAFVNPAGLDTPKNRAALAQTFVDRTTGGAFTVVVNHFKSKGSSCGPGDDDPLAGSCDLTRTLAARELARWLATDPTGSGDRDVLIVGDLNSYDEETPIAELAAAGYRDALELADVGPGEFAYTYVFDGEYGHLDYVLVGASLVSQLTGATAWHINADEPDILDYDTTFKKDPQDAIWAPDPYRASDHDPVLVGLEPALDPLAELRALRAELAELAASGDAPLRVTRGLERALERSERMLTSGREAAAAAEAVAAARRAERAALPAAAAEDLAARARRVAAALR